MLDILTGHTAAIASAAQKDRKKKKSVEIQYRFVTPRGEQLNESCPRRVLMP